MADQQTTNTLQEHIQRLQQLSAPNRNDIRHARYATYVTAFLEPLGDERVYLVGSTRENTKLRWSTDGGDSDFVLVSGKLKVPVESMEHREGMADYIWIKTDKLKTNLLHLDTTGLYLCPTMLKTVSTKLFTTLRGIYTITTSTSDSIPGRTRRITTTADNSKVGLARKEFENLHIEGNIHIFSEPTTKMAKPRNAAFALYLQRRWSETNCLEEEKKLLKRFFAMVGSCKLPGLKADGFGKFLSFASKVDASITRPPIIGDLEVPENADFVNDLDMDIVDASAEKVKATYTRVSSKDFVPVLVVDGTLHYMSQFMERVNDTYWPGQKLAEDIFKTDIFVVARTAPINADTDKDFRISFNLAEIMLVNNFPSVAKKIYIVLKAYLKGALRKKCISNSQKNKLRSYHMKTALFWICEQQHPEFWDECHIELALREVLQFIQACLKKERLEHYFIRSNLFADFSKSDFILLSEGFGEILSSPIKSLEVFFEMDLEVQCEVWLTPGEVSRLKGMKDDGGMNRNIDQIEDALIDLLRGVGESPRDEGEAPPCKKALIAALDMFLEDEKQDAVKSAENAQTRGPNDAKVVSNILNQLVTGGGNQSSTRRDASQRLDLVVGIASLFPGGRHILDNIGGKQGLQRVLQASNDETVDKHTRLRTVFKRFLDCDEETESDVAFELKQEIAAYFIGREGP